MTEKSEISTEIEKSQINTQSDMVFTQEFENFQTEKISISKDKLENILMKHLKKLTISKDWWAPTGLFVSSLLALLTSTFKVVLGIPKELWQMLFIFALVGSFGWGIYAVTKAVKNIGKNEIEDLIDLIKDNQNK